MTGRRSACGWCRSRCPGRWRVTQLRAFAAGLETVLVVEDKLPFVEAQLKEALYRAPRTPWVLGKQDARGARAAAGRRRRLR